MARVVGMKQRYDPCFFKLDGFMASCDTAAHPHHLGGDYAREANVDAVEELFAVMRKADHPVHLDPTSGMWLSPWWLRTVDSIYADTYDGEPPTIRLPRIFVKEPPPAAMLNIACAAGRILGSPPARLKRWTSISPPRLWATTT